MLHHCSTALAATKLCLYTCGASTLRYTIKLVLCLSMKSHNYCMTEIMKGCAYRHASAPGKHMYYTLVAPLHCTKPAVQHAIDLHNAVVCACRFLRGICSHQCAVYGSVCTSKVCTQQIQRLETHCCCHTSTTKTTDAALCMQLHAAACSGPIAR
jgi:hypothetical protein